jgi:predicted amidophosphoribosyltransferase
MLSTVRDSFRYLIDLLYPNTCQVCGATVQTKEEILCISCRLKLPETNAHKTNDPELLNRLAGRVPVRYVWAYLHFRKQGSTQRLIHQFKYKGKKETAFALGRWYGQDLSRGKRDIPLADLIVGVPLHPTRLRHRGYNQADWLAMGLSESLDIPWRDDVLVRQHFGGSPSQIAGRTWKRPLAYRSRMKCAGDTLCWSTMY